jgi:hypothetical protein
MYILRVEHSVDDYAGWKKAFDSDPVGRRKFGVRRYQILRPVDNPNYVMIDLAFDTAKEAEALLATLRLMWGRVESPVMSDPKARIVEPVETITLWTPVDASMIRAAASTAISWCFVLWNWAAQTHGINDLPWWRIPKEGAMPKYVVEREIPGVGKMTPDELREISRKSCAVLREMGPEIQWLESFVTDDKLYCVYIAPSAAPIQQHADRGGFPANRILQVKRMIDPTTAE